MPSYVSPFTGDVVQQTDVTYYALNFGTNTQLYWPSVLNGTQVPASRIMDCTPSANNLTIFLPDASQGSNGIDILFRNFGSRPFFIAQFGGSGSVSIAVGESKYFYLSNNSTQAGVWQNVTFGTGTSSADAASLAGAGLAAISGKLAVSQAPITSSSAPTITNASRANTFVWTGGNGAFTIPLSSTLSAGWWIGFRNNGTGSLVLTPATGELINKSANISVPPGGSGFIFYQQSTTEFYTIGLQTPSNVTFTSAVYDVDNIVGPTLSLVTFAPFIQTYVSLSGARTTDLTVVLPATTSLYVLINDTTTTSYSILFSISGSVAAPTVLAPGSIITALSDGNQLIVLSQSSSLYFYGADGSASLPTFSFLSDAATGMYLDSPGVLGLTANNTNMLLLDNSVPSTPLISTPANISTSATITATGNISTSATITATGGVLGGTF
jgi:hypothetical protein